jgi:hypothetical protein
VDHFGLFRREVAFLRPGDRSLVVAEEEVLDVGRADRDVADVQVAETSDERVHVAPDHQVDILSGAGEDRHAGQGERALGRR